MLYILLSIYLFYTKNVLPIIYEERFTCVFKDRKSVPKTEKESSLIVIFCLVFLVMYEATRTLVAAENAD